MSQLNQCYEKDIKMDEFELYFEIPLITLYVITSILITIFNFLVSLTIIKTPSLRRSPSRILLASLTVNDVLIGAIAHPLYIVYCIAALKKSTSVFCIIYLVNIRITYSLETISLFILTVISIDRYLAVATKTAYKTMVTAKRVKMVVLSLWLGIVLVIFTVLQFGSFDILLHIGVVTAVTILTTITFCYLGSYVILKKLSKVSNGCTENQRTSDFNIIKYRRSLNNMLIVLVMTLVSYVPVVVVAAVNVIVDLENKVFAVHVAQSLTGFHSVINPLFYVWRMNDIRSGLKNLIKKLIDLFGLG
ncbi:cannabinoid receptor 2-like [Actinia tenebrosa]|uniref:Cannabinoid receptor 2-like n=1 Tax=Actinia tenebrosa TaxID=6105 RepID=A0A6P8JAV8_ACTTE|nr:cannabinoid receptor 2-like [Actinia tenebrosa]